ncbi:glycosyltransferase family 4 protein [Desulfuromonas carbonis]|uniref:glycosyltransferase family 4 protein n=1 Tax=Desulfuromonas sp. DDH964 TaxID=1823759 RepID=UPI00078E04DE|nr:glycosyltransferase family 4 protein [Desulfuromonas sp. DDH964]AMV72667.1 YqgM-like family glycosyltransferase [Desulfuromonas sp. DDH964]
MRIIQLLPELNEGGVERGVVELSRELVRLGHDSLVLSAGGNLAPQIAADGGRHISFDLCSKNPLTAPLRVVQLRRLLENLRPDILHARSRVPAWLGWLANRSLQLPFVTTVHGFNSVNAYSRVMTFGDRVICVSSAIRDYVQLHYGVPTEKMVVIPRGVDLVRFDPGQLDRQFQENFSREYGLEGRYVITSVGRITQLKDYETFIDALVRVKTVLPEVLGLIVGGVREDKQTYFRQLQQRIASAGAEEYIRFTGSQRQVAEIYALSDLVVSASKKPESFGRAAAEALAMETPVLATNHGGVVDIVRDGETGYLFPPGEAALLADLILRARLTSFAGLRDFVAKNFTLERMVAETLTVYKSELSKGSPGPNHEDS